VDRGEQAARLRTELENTSSELLALQTEAASLKSAVAAMQAQRDDAEAGRRLADMEREVLQKQVINPTGLQLGKVDRQ
jgi:hypothetical protein